MNKNWNYAKLSKLAKAAGGPESLIRIIEKFSEQKGVIKTIPFVGIAFAAGIGVARIIPKLCNYFKKMKSESEATFVQAKQELIQGIIDYDIDHSEDSNDDDNEEEDKQ